MCTRQRWTGMPWYAVGSAAISPALPSTQIIRQAASVEGVEEALPFGSALSKR